MRLRLLLSARDPGAAQLVAQLVPVLAYTPGVELKLLAQGAAIAAFRTAGLAHDAIDLAALAVADDPLRPTLLARAQQVLDAWRPDAVVVGLSGPGIGIDEALTLQCADRPVIALQDYEGWVVNGFGRRAPDYLVADDAAAQLTRRHPGIRTHTIGALKYARYAHLDVLSLRETGRRLLGDAPLPRQVVTFYGQPAWGFEGYRETVSAFTAQAGASGAAVQWLYRAHPKETADERRGLVDLFGAAGLLIAPCPAPDIDTSLAMTDGAVTVFSSAAIDHVYLQRVAPAPMGVAWFLLIHPAIRSRLRHDNGSEEPAVAQQGLALCTRHASEIGPTLAALADGRLRQQQAERIAQALPDPASAAASARDIILRLAREPGSRG